MRSFHFPANFLFRFLSPNFTRLYSHTKPQTKITILSSSTVSLSPVSEAISSSVLQTPFDSVSNSQTKPYFHDFPLSSASFSCPNGCRAANYFGGHEHFNPPLDKNKPVIAEYFLNVQDSTAFSKNSVFLVSFTKKEAKAADSLLPGFKASIFPLTRSVSFVGKSFLKVKPFHKIRKHIEFVKPENFGEAPTLEQLYRYLDSQKPGSSTAEPMHVRISSAEVSRMYNNLSLDYAKILFNYWLSFLGTVKGNKLYVVTDVLLKDYGRSGFIRYLGEDRFHLLFYAIYHRIDTFPAHMIFKKQKLLEWLVHSAYKKGYKLFYIEKLILIRSFLEIKDLDRAVLVFNSISDPGHVDKLFVEASWLRENMNEEYLKKRVSFDRISNIALWTGISSSLISACFREMEFFESIQLVYTFKNRYIQLLPFIEEYVCRYGAHTKESRPDFHIVLFSRLNIRSHALNSILLRCISFSKFEIAAILYMELTRNLNVKPDYVSFRYFVMGSRYRSHLGSESVNSLVLSKQFVNYMKKYVPAEYINQKLDALSPLLLQGMSL
ncbi:hypothetical protein BB560_000372 [Smittium megazygosporum]|uniref:Uncharacterized protein n=1 Tax=Smittium megazygosporum TaxID=133381 RepID=A0A2T9ZKJ0_9FUNG|nr:hypothetical protein BB560_000372 [Smittium megazygosporum]